jgi:uncharacterized membrane protein (DUF485 family)
MRRARVKPNIQYVFLFYKLLRTTLGTLIAFRKELFGTELKPDVCTIGMIFYQLGNPFKDILLSHHVPAVFAIKDRNGNTPIPLP